METIVANYDGPLYIVVAKTFYNSSLIKSDFQFPLPVEYYAAHFPLFPFLIRIFSGILGFPYSMLFITVAASFVALYFFNKFIKQYVNPKEALFLTFVFSIFPARWLVVRSVGSAEPLFLAGIIASIYYFQNKKYLLSSIWGAIAQLTKSPAILLFIAYICTIAYPIVNSFVMNKLSNLRKNLDVRTFLVFLIPIALLFVFVIYKFTYNNFLAYFNSGDNIHLFFPPFEIFNYSQPWVNTHWLEEIVFIYMLCLSGVLLLYKKKDLVLFSFVSIFFISTIFVSHRDLMRYSLPVVPFLFPAYSKYLVSKEFKIVIVFLVLPIYLFSLAFISNNVMPISNWAPFL
jgi:Gpi18-like mannosyltransferase